MRRGWVSYTNKCDFSLRLKSPKLMSCRSSGGRAFHILGPAAEKLLSPKLLWVTGGGRGLPIFLRGEGYPNFLVGVVLGISGCRLTPHRLRFCRWLFCCCYKSVVCCDAAGGDIMTTMLLTVSLTRQERGLLKMSLVPQAASSGRPGPLYIADMYGTGIAISDKLQVLTRFVQFCRLCYQSTNQSVEFIESAPSV